jgi:PPOX class probable F420-dependent enzyme
MDAEHCRARFAAARVVRLATVTAEGAPHLVPVTCAVIDDRIVFAVDHKPKTTHSLRRLANIAAEPRVSFLADEYDDDWTRLWWVRADAMALVLNGGPQRSAALDVLACKYQQYRQRRPTGTVVAADVLRWTGWSADRR